MNTIQRDIIAGHLSWYLAVVFIWRIIVIVAIQLSATRCHELDYQLLGVLRDHVASDVPTPTGLVTRLPHLCGGFFDVVSIALMFVRGYHVQVREAGHLISGKISV